MLVWGGLRNGACPHTYTNSGSFCVPEIKSLVHPRHTSSGMPIGCMLRKDPKLFDDRLLLIGDAAGLAYPNSGEGIRPAIESALIAADVIAQAAGDYGSNSLADYQDRLVERLGLPQSQQIDSWLPACVVATHCRWPDGDALVCQKRGRRQLVFAPATRRVEDHQPSDCGDQNAGIPCCQNTNEID